MKAGATGGTGENVSARGGQQCYDRTAATMGVHHDDGSHWGTSGSSEESQIHCKYILARFNSTTVQMGGRGEERGKGGVIN